MHSLAASFEINISIFERCPIPRSFNLRRQNFLCSSHSLPLLSIMPLWLPSALPYLNSWNGLSDGLAVTCIRYCKEWIYRTKSIYYYKYLIKNLIKKWLHNLICKSPSIALHQTRLQSVLVLNIALIVGHMYLPYIWRYEACVSRFCCETFLEVKVYFLR